MAEGALGSAPGRRARARLARHPAALLAAGVLALMVAACLFGPAVTGHPYDRIHPDYVRVPPSARPYPGPEQVEAALRRVAARMRVTVESRTLESDRIDATLVAAKPIDERLLVYFSRSDVFGEARVRERQEGGTRLLVDAPILRQRFLLGTDSVGRDLLTRTLVAGRVSLAVGLLATAVALIVGVLYGAVAGYAGGRVDALMMRAVDVLYALPFVFLVILLVVVFGRNVVLVFVAIGAVEWLDMARIVRGQTLSIKRREYVLAAEALGVTTPGILRRHVIPNVLSPVIVYATLMVPKVILLESFLSFLGLGVREPMTSWGVLVAEGARTMEAAPYMLAVPAAFLVVTLLAANVAGDGLRDALDPREAR